ncbi:O-antigen ligase family protein [Lysinibacillus yapensis]
MVSLTVYHLTNNPSFSILHRILYYSEWFGGKEVMRFVALMEYSNLIVLFFMFFYPLYSLFILELQYKLLKIPLLIIGLIPIFSTFSRSGYIIILIYLLSIALLYFYRKMNCNLFISFISFLSACCIFIFMYTGFSQELFSVLNELLSAREGSNDSRTFLITESIRVTIENSPIIGMGIKTTSSIGYPLGSHSTFVGFFYKAGIIGFILSLIIFTIIAIKLLISKGNLTHSIMKLSLLLMIPMFIVEDIDGSNWLIIFYFIFASILINKKNTHKNF